MTAEELKRKWGETGNDTQQRVAGRFKPGVAAVRTQPLYTGHPFYHLSYPSAPGLHF